MRLVTWNVNSIRARLPRVLAFLERTRPDVLCVQETKVEDAAFPRAELEAAGWVPTIFGQKTYNGVAFLSRTAPEDVRRGFPDDPPGAQARLVAGTFGPVRVVNVYVPNGGTVVSEKFAYKLEWLSKLRAYLDAHEDRGRPLLLCGDFNVAPDDRDVYDTGALDCLVLFHEDVRRGLERVREFGLVDALRQKTESAGVYTYWDYRAGAFHRNFGFRIDHLFATEPLARTCREVKVDREERKGAQASDHAPVIGEFDLA
jgi:exodeoxyribonuclease-3